jgi:hypothetical protein
MKRLLILAGILVCSISIVFAQEKNNKNTNKYFSLGCGAGLSYGSYGVKAQINTGKTTGFGYHFGLGTLFSDDVNADAGIKVYPYKWWYLNAQVGYLMYKEEYPAMNDNLLGSDSKFYLYGAIMTGGDFFFTNHFGANIGAGVAFFEDNTTPTLELGIIYRFQGGTIQIMASGLLNEYNKPKE